MRIVSNTSFPALAALLLLALASACGDSDGTTSGAGGAQGTGGGATTGTGGASACPTPLFAGTSCDGFLDGCFAPDTSGTCTDTGLKLEWSDGHIVDRNISGTTAGLIAPGEATPCITLAFDAATGTATLTKTATGEVLTNQDLGGGNIKITCPNGEVIDTDPDATNADNVCRGLACGR
jgi:hypothetical protein